MSDVGWVVINYLLVSWCFLCNKYAISTGVEEIMTLNPSKANMEKNCGNCKHGLDINVSTRTGCTYGKPHLTISFLGACNNWEKKDDV